MSVLNTKMTALADAIRDKSGIEDTLSISEMTDAVKSIDAGGGKNEDLLITHEIITYTNTRISKLKMGAFCGASKLTSVNLPKVSNIPSYAFYQCTNLVTASIPSCTGVGPYAFTSCRCVVLLAIMLLCHVAIS